MNTCDRNEVNALALAKFLELCATQPEKIVFNSSYTGGIHIKSVRLGKYVAECSIDKYKSIFGCLKLDYQVVYTFFNHNHENVRYPQAINKLYEADSLNIESDPVYDLIVKENTAFDNKTKQAECEALLKTMANADKTYKDEDAAAVAYIAPVSYVTPEWIRTSTIFMFIVVCLAATIVSFKLAFSLAAGNLLSYFIQAQYQISRNKWIDWKNSQNRRS